MKRKDECLACSRRACYHRVVSVDAGKPYDEIACQDHVMFLHGDSDAKAPGVMKHFITGSAKQKRREKFSA